MKEFTTIRNNVNIYYLNDYFRYLEEKNDKRKALLVMKKNLYLKQFIGLKVGAYKIIGVFEDENKFALTNGVDIVYMNAEDVLRFIRALQERL